MVEPQRFGWHLRQVKRTALRANLQLLAVLEPRLWLDLQRDHNRVCHIQRENDIAVEHSFRRAGYPPRAPFWSEHKEHREGWASRNTHPHTHTFTWNQPLCVVLVYPPPPPPPASEAAAGVGIDPQISVKLRNFRTPKAVFLDHFVLEQPANQVRTFLYSCLRYGKEKKRLFLYSCLRYGKEKKRQLKSKICLFQIATQHMWAPEDTSNLPKRPNSELLPH